MGHMCMELTEQRLPSSFLGLPHHVASWEQHWDAEPVKQIFKIKSIPMDRGMDTKPMIVQCPKCRTLLQEPPPGNPFYECGSCFATLQAKHATQEDLDIRMQQKAFVKRMESDKTTKSGPSEDGFKVFLSDSSSETAEREEHALSGEGSPSWSPSRREPPLYGQKLSRSSQVFQQRQPAEPLDKHQYYPQNVAPRAQLDRPMDTVEALGQNLHRLGVEDNYNTHRQNMTPANPDRVHGHSDQQKPSMMRRLRSEQYLVNRDSEGHRAPSHQVQKSVSFNQSVSVATINSNHSGGGERSTLPPKDVHQASRGSPIISPLIRGEPGQHVMESLHLQANHNGRNPHMMEGFRNQQDMYAAADILDYETSDHASSVGDGDSYQAMVLESNSRPSSGELDSYVVLDHRVTRPGSYQRTSSAGKNASGHDRQQPDGESFSRNQQPEWLQIGAYQAVPRVQQRPAVTSYHVQQPAHVLCQMSTSPPHSTHGKPPAGQNGQMQQESNVQVAGTRARTCPSLPGPDEAPYVVCQHCGQLLTVPANLPQTKKAYQKLRCGACMKISVFLLMSDDHITGLATSPKGPVNDADFSSAHQRRSSSPPDSASSGRHGTPNAKSEMETASGGSQQRLPPTARNFPRIPSGSKLSAMSSAANGSSTNGHGAVANGPPTWGNVPNYGDGMSFRTTHAPAGPHGEHVMYAAIPRGSSGSDYEVHHAYDGRFHQTSSESENDSPRRRVPRVPSMNTLQNEQFHMLSHMAPDRSVSQQYSKDGGYTQGVNSTSNGMKGIMKKGVKEMSKPKQASSSNQYRRKVIVNGSAVPDVLVKRAEGLAGPIHPGSYWYDSQAGFWGLAGGPCLGIIPPYIEELNIPLARHCSGGETGVLVNGRELHKSDYDLLVQRGLPPTLGMAYYVDIDGRVKDAVSGAELRGLGPLAPTLEQIGRGHGMWVPGSSKVA